MSSLIAFEAAARTGGYGRAATSLSLTQSAISRQIATLEAWLGAPLFARKGRGVMLTPMGEAYAAEVSVALERIRNATAAALAAPDTTETVEIATLPSFGMRWLAPRLPDLMAQHPSLIVNFSARVSPFDFQGEQFDGAIHFGDAAWRGAMADRLMGEEMAPVCSPAVAARLRRLEDVAEFHLLSLSTRPEAWRRWMEQAGLPGAKLRPGPMFEQFMMMTQAAAAGAGIALAPRFLVEPELKSGALVIPFDLMLRSAQAYYLVYPASHLSRPAFQRFRSWLIDTAQRWEAAAAHGSENRTTGEGAVANASDSLPA